MDKKNMTWQIPVSQEFAVDESVFRVVPNYHRYVVAALAGSSATYEPTSDLLDSLSEAMRTLPSRMLAQNPAEDPRIQVWREAFRETGSSPSKFRSSVEAIVRRGLRGELSSLNSYLIDLGTVATLNFLTPVGVHTLDGLPQGQLKLRPARGDESFTDFGGGVEFPEAGEIIYCVESTVLTRRWVWRQGRDGSVGERPTALAVNIDIAEPSLVSGEDVVQAVTDMLSAGGFDVRGSGVITSETPSIALDFAD
jgi:DNA/RNA-binding domain of Phe-tRNA-synthetase-like protein